MIRAAVWRVLLMVSMVAALAALAVAGETASTGAGVLSPATGQGSTSAAPAFQQWSQTAQNDGLNVQYTPTSSPAGLGAYANGTADFAGSEAEYSELSPGQPVDVPRGYAYAPDVAEGTALMYNVALSASGQNPVNTLRLSPPTVARIFLGLISNWDDPAISADNGGVVLPNEPITVVCRTGQSGTTALFYDFIAHTDPTDYAAWAAANGFPTDSRILEVDHANSPTAMACQSGSDTQANYIAASRWTIGYDEFGYASIYNDDVASIENASGNWVQPYALNISAALQSATLAPDTSEDLNGVYTSTNPLAYPISSYSYLVYQCAKNPAIPTCVAPYANQGVANTMAQFMDFIACAGQVHMATFGYAPLPPNLSQLLANAAGRLTGQPPLELTPQNCANPLFISGGQDATTTRPSVTPARAVAGQKVTYIAKVSSTAGAPIGRVTFSTGSTTLCSVATQSNGSVSCTSAIAPVGIDPVIATFVGYGTFAGSSGTTTLNVAPATPPVTQPSSISHGYWLVGSDGGIFTFGSAQFYGSTGSLKLQRPVVGIVPTGDDAGYWLDASDGGIFSFGDTQFYGSIPGLGLHPAGSGLPNSLDAPIVGMVPSNDDGGYFTVASDGGVFAFGDAHFAGSCPSIGGCSSAAVAVMPDASGNGYWLVTKTGTVYTFGDAGYYGAPGNTGSPVTSAVRTPDGGGYWILTANGSVYSYGDAANHGDSAGAFGGFNPASAIFTTSDGGGYWITSATGHVDRFGDAPAYGDMSGTKLNGFIIAATGF